VSADGRGGVQINANGSGQVTPGGVNVSGQGGANATGAGYEVLISDRISWRVIDAHASFDMGTRRTMDRVGHWVDLGLQIGTGLVF
jgi:hypothetical protein